jgi:hypothetical protein
MPGEAEDEEQLTEQGYGHEDDTAPPEEAH